MTVVVILIAAQPPPSSYTCYSCNNKSGSSSQYKSAFLKSCFPSLVHPSTLSGEMFGSYEHIKMSVMTGPRVRIGVNPFCPTCQCGYQVVVMETNLIFILYCPVRYM